MLIPIFFTFNEAYALPAAVAIDSLLRHAAPHHDYRLHVLHSGLSRGAEASLQRVVARYANAQLALHNTEGWLTDAEASVGKSHYSKEIYFKLTAASVFPDYDRILCTDVDVIFCGDVSETFTAFAGEDFYIAGVDTILPSDRARLYTDFTPDEQHWLARELCAGFLLYNLSAIRRDSLEAQMTQYYMSHYARLPFPEQDCMAVCCRDRVRHLSMRYVVCNNYYGVDPARTPFYPLNACLPTDEAARREAFAQALAQPIQLHYIGPRKPWNSLGVARQGAWLRALWASGETPRFVRVLPSIVAQKLRRYSLARFWRKLQARFVGDGAKQ